MSGVPYTFATATTSIPLSQLDANFNTVATLGNASVGLGNTTTTVGNLTLTNTTIQASGGSLDNVIIGANTASTGAFTNVSVSNITSNVTFTSTGFIQLPNGTTAQRPSGNVAGQIRFNSTSNTFEGNNGTYWGGIGGAQANSVIQINNTVVSSNYTIASGQNGFSVGPVTINSGITVTVSTGQRWVIL